jgi:Zn-dependent protease
MKLKELVSILIAIVVLSIVTGFSFAYARDWNHVSQAILFSTITIAFFIICKKFAASLLDADVEHRTWTMSRYGYRPEQKLNSEWPTGVILPIIGTVFSLGLFKIMTLLAYEARAKAYRSARRFGFYSYTELTDWHNGLIGAAGVISLLLLSFIAYFANFEYLAKIAAYYAFFNMIPISDLDGTQIFMGSRILWTALAVITLIFTAYALIL